MFQKLITLQYWVPSDRLRSSQKLNDFRWAFSNTIFQNFQTKYEVPYVTTTRGDYIGHSGLHRSAVSFRLVNQI